MGNSLFPSSTGLALNQPAWLQWAGHRVTGAATEAGMFSFVNFNWTAGTPGVVSPLDLAGSLRTVVQTVNTNASMGFKTTSGSSVLTVNPAGQPPAGLNGDLLLIPGIDTNGGVGNFPTPTPPPFVMITSNTAATQTLLSGGPATSTTSSYQSKGLNYTVPVVSSQNVTVHNTTAATLTNTTGLVTGTTYLLISQHTPPGTTFTWTSGTNITLSQAATASTSTSEPCAITCTTDMYTGLTATYVSGTLAATLSGTPAWLVSGIPYVIMDAGIMYSRVFTYTGSASITLPSNPNVTGTFPTVIRTLYPTLTTTTGSTAAILGHPYNLQSGATYVITNAAVPAGTTFTYTGSLAITLSAPALSTGVTNTSMIVFNVQVGMSVVFTQGSSSRPTNVGSGQYYVASVQSNGFTITATPGSTTGMIFSNSSDPTLALGSVAMAASTTIPVVSTAGLSPGQGFYIWQTSIDPGSSVTAANCQALWDTRTNCFGPFYIVSLTPTAITVAANNSTIYGYLHSSYHAAIMPLYGAAQTGDDVYVGGSYYVSPPSTSFGETTAALGSLTLSNGTLRNNSQGFQGTVPLTVSNGITVRNGGNIFDSVNDPTHPLLLDANVVFDVGGGSISGTIVTGSVSDTPAAAGSLVRLADSTANAPADLTVYGSLSITHAATVTIGNDTLINAITFPLGTQPYVNDWSVVATLVQPTVSGVSVLDEQTFNIETDSNSLAGLTVGMTVLFGVNSFASDAQNAGYATYATGIIVDVNYINGWITVAWPSGCDVNGNQFNVNSITWCAFINSATTLIAAANNTPSNGDVTVYATALPSTISIGNPVYVLSNYVLSNGDMNNNGFSSPAPESGLLIYSLDTSDFASWTWLGQIQQNVEGFNDPSNFTLSSSSGSFTSGNMGNYTVGQVLLLNQSGFDNGGSGYAVATVTDVNLDTGMITFSWNGQDNGGNDATGWTCLVISQVLLPLITLNGAGVSIGQSCILFIPGGAPSINNMICVGATSPAVDLNTNSAPATNMGMANAQNYQILPVSGVVSTVQAASYELSGASLNVYGSYVMQPTNGINDCGPVNVYAPTLPPQSTVLPSVAGYGYVGTPIAMGPGLAPATASGGSTTRIRGAITGR